ncbi:phage tail assembly chaperone [Sphingomonas sp.]
MDRKRLQGLAGAALGWRPWEFWSSTPVEFFHAFEAWRQINCPK